VANWFVSVSVLIVSSAHPLGGDCSQLARILSQDLELWRLGGIHGPHDKANALISVVEMGSRQMTGSVACAYSTSSAFIGQVSQS
jgi:hypothetical protein